MIKRKGFTLIELLVVIGIIALLSTLAVVALNNARQKARDAKRVADIKQIQTALELYYQDEAYYPFHVSTTPVAIGTGDFVKINGADIFEDAADATSPTYMGVVPRDPSTSTGCTFGTTVFGEAATTATAPCSYLYRSNGSAVGVTNSRYEIALYLEGATGVLSAGSHCASETGISNTTTCSH